MPLLLECPSGHKLKIPSKLAGHTIVCPVCDEKLDVPPLKAPAPAPAPMLRPVGKKNVAAAPSATPSPAPPAPAENIRETKPESSDAEQARSVQEESLDASLEQTTESDETEIPPTDPVDIETHNTEAPQVAIPISDPINLPPADALSVTKIVDQSDLPPVIPDLEDTPVDSPPVVEVELEANETSPQPPPQLNHPLAAAWEEQPWSAMQTLDVATEVGVESEEPAEQGELFTEEQSYLIDQVVAEVPAGPAWVFVGEEPSPQPAGRTNFQPQNLSVFLLALAAVVVAMLSIVPAVMDHLAAAQEGGSPDRWTYIVLLGAVVQIAVAILATSIPDWSTQWIGALVTTGFASMYALGLALTMFARQDHVLVRDLGLLDEAFRNQAQPWCFFVLCMTLILAFCYGRASLRWYYTEKQFGVARV